MRESTVDKQTRVLGELLQKGEFARLIPASRLVLRGNKQHHFAHKTLTTALLESGDVKSAIPALHLAVRKFPRDAELLNNLGIAYSLNLQWPSAMQWFQRSLQLDPDNAITHKNLGLAYFRMHRWYDALAPLGRAIELYDGEYVEAISLLASALEQDNKLDEARECLLELLDDSPDNRHFLAALLSVNAKVCDWRDWDALLGRLKASLFDPTRPGAMCNPFTLFSLPGFSAHDVRRATELFAHAAIPARCITPITSAQDIAAARGKIMTLHQEQRPLRVAYLSADFRSHPVGLILPEIIERHDRSRVYAIAYALTGDDGSAIRQRLENAFDRFVLLQDRDQLEIAAAMRADRIDILIDLHGWTAGGRPEVLATRPAPLIINWLGYAGTLGDRQLADYVIGDPVVTPMDSAAAFSEKIVHLPRSYLPYDTTCALEAPPPRATVGLPEDGFVFCSFNNVYKINPEVFDLWCRILVNCPGSVLWLSGRRASARKNLAQEAERRGVDPQRLLFAEPVTGHEAHLARISVADLALDPFPYNSHSTGLDTLWAGVPMVTLLGETFAGRVGASLLEFAGFPELIAATKDAYAEIAMRLFCERELLDTFKQRLANGRTQRNMSIFDMEGFARDLESLYCHVWQDRLNPLREPMTSP